MQKKKKILKKRIFALVVVCLIVTLSVIPCFADDYVYANNIASIPIQFDVYYNGDIAQGGDTVREILEFGGVVDYSERDYIMIDSYPSYQNRINVGFNANDETIILNGDATEFDFPFLDGFTAEYALTIGNFLIDPAYDDFTFEVYVNQGVTLKTSLVYSVLGENSVGEMLTFVTDDYVGSNFIYSLSDGLSQLGVGDTDVYVYALNISFYTANVYSVGYTIEIYESNSLRNRNLNLVGMDLNGEIFEVENNSLTPLEEFFKSLAIDEYKSAFDNYTADYTSWIGTAVGGFLNMELAPFFSIGGILLICVALGLVGYFLKVFMGG